MCQAAAHRHKTVQYALFEIVDSSCKLDPPMSFYRSGHLTERSELMNTLLYYLFVNKPPKDALVKSHGIERLGIAKQSRTF